MLASPISRCASMQPQVRHIGDVLHAWPPGDGRSGHEDGEPETRWSAQTVPAFYRKSIAVLESGCGSPCGQGPGLRSETARRDAIEAPEAAREMRLVVETNLRGYVGQRLALQDPDASGLEPATNDVGVGRDPELVDKRTSHLRRPAANMLGSRVQRDRFEQMRVEEGAERLGNAG